MLPWMGPDARRRRLEKQARRWVVRMIDDPDRHAGRLQLWLDGDPVREFVYRQLSTNYVDAGPPAMQLYGTLRQRMAPFQLQAVSRPPYAYLLLATSGLVLAGVAVTAGTSFIAREMGYYEPRFASRDEVVSTNAGETRRLSLVDGSSITISPASRLRVAFNHHVRAISLERGRVRFSVAHHPYWPFVVAAGGGTVTARGTLFEIEVGRYVQVHLLSGVVDVRTPPSGVAPKRTTHLTTGGRMLFEPASPTTLPSSRPPETAMTTFDNVPVRDIIDAANRRGARPIMLSDPSIGTKLVFMDLDVRDTDGVAKNLAAYLHLDVDDSRHDRIVLAQAH